MATSVSSTNFLTTLGAGSGVDTKALAQNLADAEITPRKDAINAKITKTEARISGYGYLKTALSDLKTAFGKLDDASDFSSIAAANTQPSAFNISVGASAKTGTYMLEVNQLARAQRSAPSIMGKSCFSGETELMLVYIRGLARNSSSVRPPAMRVISITSSTRSAPRL